MKQDLYIIAAGKGSRMGGNVPKALVPITDGEPNLTTTLMQIAHKFDNVFVVTNILIQDQWEAYFAELGPLGHKVINVPISSGLGDGHAVMWGFAGAQMLIPNGNEDVVVCWGDVFIQYAEIIDELLAQPLVGSGLLPVVRENNPYVSLLVDEHMSCKSADFSKYGENHPTGFHDQSIFRFRKDRLWNSLGVLHSAFWKNGRYITPGGELSLLYAFHYLYNEDAPLKVYETEYPTIGFNTLDEVAAIQREIKANFNNQLMRDIEESLIKSPITLKPKYLKNAKV